ncbi:GTP cyclohydrolase II [Subtercola boreus]|uniref:GTP cyclohydrolase-2 n=1 Tax=Subtercola boreus TaxID=120213 RepID=A0A3E0WD70_9MICO|nr:GTP cyclohydrolase II [Subtercola boreus]RFA22579.1 bifunctional 3,4-dihydroxy-2-butanone-4-phosphate synthase/GTP cyclohydrolase II [Subtercola boreus]RFA22935.1 bifunctional 3,4-dihydroxy-2-butanone-4-phosphate synthase/GTP cyclohydrolase II [Subtercola boreus]RFA28686.1 bifunctional 3,4-dihydroxy-2-butanone-4-phosphate synthase/GTP cyclohydrolase II [Subtercola boreus]
MSLASIPEVLEALRAGRPVIVADAENRENEGDAILAAELASPEWIAWMVRHTSGFLCAPMTASRAAELELPPMVVRNEDSLRTAYTVTVDASTGVTTGISASDRAHTLRTLASGTASPSSFIRPGHVLPVVAVEGGVRQRAGHTEATVDLLKLAGLVPVGVIGEVVADDGSMERLPGLLALGEREGLPVTTIEALLTWLSELDAPRAAVEPSPRVTFEVETRVPTIHGSFEFRAYHDQVTGADHLAIVSGDPSVAGALVRVHSECLTGEAFGSLKCECGPQLDAALDLIAEHGGVVVYLRGHEGRGIGLLNKLRAYRLQEDGLDTIDANTALELPVDARDYGSAAAILRDLGLGNIHLLTNNPEKVRQLQAHGIGVSTQEALIVGRTPANERYLDTKRDRMGHLLPSGL